MHKLDEEIGAIYTAQMDNKEQTVLVHSRLNQGAAFAVFPILSDTDLASDVDERTDYVKLPSRISSLNSYISVNCRVEVQFKNLITKQNQLDFQEFEQLLRTIVLKETQFYYNNIHRNIQEEVFTPGQSRVDYGGRVFNSQELEYLVDASLDFYLTASRYDKEFCLNFSHFLSKGLEKRIHVLTTNSGSSANLLSITALTSILLGEDRIKPGDEVITLAAGFPTTIGPIIQNGLIPVFVDIERETYNISVSQIENVISEKTKAIFIAHTMGVPFDLESVLQIAETHQLWLIEDNCDSLGAEYKLSREYSLFRNKKVGGRNFTGTFGHIGTSSFYPPHQITMGEGGAVYTSDQQLHSILRSLRDWGKECTCEAGEDGVCGQRHNQQSGLLPFGYDHKYVYNHLGFNLKITDMQAAIGCAQLEKLPQFIKARRKNWLYLYQNLKELKDTFQFQSPGNIAYSSPFGFILTVRKGSKYTRDEIIRYLEENKIQTRLLFAGNMIKQPVFVNNEYHYRRVKNLSNTDTAMKDTFWVGVSPGLSKKKLDYMIEKILSFA